MAEKLCNLSKNGGDITRDDILTNVMKVYFIQQGGWLVNASQMLYYGETKPTITTGSIVGDRVLTSSEINALNESMGFNSATHAINYQTTDSRILSALNGKAVNMTFA